MELTLTIHKEWIPGNVRNVT